MVEILAASKAKNIGECRGPEPLAGRLRDTLRFIFFPLP